VTPWIKITIISTLVASITSSFWFYYRGKNIGSMEANMACTLALGSQQKALQEANEKVRVMVAQQRDSYRVALNIRNDEYERINQELTTKEKEIEVLINESTDACVTATIPDDFK
jgi:hypothetical protein